METALCGFSGPAVETLWGRLLLWLERLTWSPPQCLPCGLFLKKFFEIQFTYHKIHPLKVYSSVVSSIFPRQGNHRHYLIPEYFRHPAGNPDPLAVTPHLPRTPAPPPRPSPRQTLIRFPSQWIRLFRTSHVNDITRHAWFLFLRIYVLKGQPCNGTCQGFTPLYG